MESAGTQGTEPAFVAFWQTVVPGYEKLAKAELVRLFGKGIHAASSAGQTRFRLPLGLLSAKEQALCCRGSALALGRLALPATGSLTNASPAQGG